MPSRLLLLAVLTLALPASGTGREGPPNVLLILVDDLGWRDLGCQGNPRLDTPVIDGLAKAGVRFTAASAPSPVCSPTRAAILTGLSPARLRITNHIPDQERFLPDDPVIWPAPMKNHLPLEHDTLAERLKARGYATGFFGKWHLSGRSRRGDQGRGDPRYAPEAQGFDVNVGGCCYGGPPTFFDPYRIHNIPPRREGEYLPDRLVDEAGTFIAKHRERPFFVALWPYAVHWPMEAPEAFLARKRGQEGPGLKDHRYGAMIEALDAALGKLLERIEAAGLEKDTVVVFTSDNGGFLGVSDCRPLRQGKGYLYEGGLRVPLIVRWPDRIPAGTTSDTPVILTDLYPTLLDLTGGLEERDRRLDGISLRPLLLEKKSPEREALYFHYPHYAWHRSNRPGAAMREGRWKLIERFDDGQLELYDLEKDPEEKHDLAPDREELAKRLSKKLRAWLEEVDAAMPTRQPPAAGD